MRCGGRPIDSRPLIMIDPVRRPTRPRMDFSVVVRPAPLRPSRVTTSPRFTREVDAVQDVRLAVEGVQVGDAQVFAPVSHARLPARRSRCPCRLPSPAGSSTPTAYGPSAMICPRCSTVIVSAMVDTTFMLCSTMSTVRFAATFLISAVTRSTSSCPMPWVGSSSSISSGSIASVVAISRARLRPYGSSTVTVDARSCRSTEARSSSARPLSFSSDLGRLPEVERRAELALQADAHVFQHREMREHRGDLERADDAAARGLRRPLVGDVDPVVQRSCRASGPGTWSAG